MKTIETLKKKCKKWQQKCGHLKAVLKETKKKGNAIRIERDQFCAEKRKLYAAFEIIRSTNEKILTLNKDLQHQNELMQAEMDEKNKMCVEFDNVCEQYTKLAVENDRLQECIELSRQKMRCVKNSKQLGDQRRILNIKKNLKHELDVCKKKVAKVHKICRDHTRKTKALLKFHEERDQYYDEVCIENEYLMQMNDDLRSDNEVIDTKFASLREQVDALRGKLDSPMLKEYNEIRVGNATIMTENDSLRREIETMRDEMKMCVAKNDLCADYDSILEENAKVLIENDQLRCRIENLKKELDSCSDETTICGYHDIHRDKNAKLSKENARLHQINKRITEELHRARENHRLVSKQYNDLKTPSAQNPGPSAEVAFCEMDERDVDR